MLWYCFIDQVARSNQVTQRAARATGRCNVPDGRQLARRQLLTRLEGAQRAAQRARVGSGGAHAHNRAVELQEWAVCVCVCL
jgi:hypothetical protein